MFDSTTPANTVGLWSRISAWFLFALHALAVTLSVLLLLSPNTVFNQTSGLASVSLNVTQLAVQLKQNAR